MITITIMSLLVAIRSLGIQKERIGMRVPLRLLIVALLLLYAKPDCLPPQEQVVTLDVTQGGSACHVDLPQRQFYCKNLGTTCQTLHELTILNWDSNYPIRIGYFYIRHCRPDNVSSTSGTVTAEAIRQVPGCGSYTGGPLRYHFVNHLSCVCASVDEVHHTTSMCPYEPNCQIDTTGQ